ncbi:MAG: sigma-E processing peptidase SpoIIGA [Clostridia bacterium]|nr:sigma-E processing peptidase SpoIIGA [Clostridia bacterium]
MENGTVYADVLALINFSMDFVALRITSSVVKLRPRLWRSVSGAAAGAFYSLAALLLGIGGVWQIPADVAAALLICLIVYGAKDAVRFFTASATFFAVGFIMGGVMTALYSKMGGYAAYLSAGGSAALAEGAIDGKTFVLLCVLSSAVAAAVGRAITLVKRKKGCTFDLECCGRFARAFCVCDSGNLVTEPISGLPVIFLCERSASFLPAGVIKYMKTGDSGECECKSSLCAVPVRTVDGSSLKYAVRCDAAGGTRGEVYRAVLALSASVPRGADGIAPAIMCESKRKPDKTG